MGLEKSALGFVNMNDAPSTSELKCKALEELDKTRPYQEKSDFGRMSSAIESLKLSAFWTHLRPRIINSRDLSGFYGDYGDSGEHVSAIVFESPNCDPVYARFDQEGKLERVYVDQKIENAPMPAASISNDLSWTIDPTSSFYELYIPSACHEGIGMIDQTPEWETETFKHLFAADKNIIFKVNVKNNRFRP